MSVIAQLFPQQMPQLIMFDLDGTLVDSVPDLATAIDLMLCDLKRPAAGIGKVRHWVGNGATALVQRALNGTMMTEETVDPALLNDAQALFFKHYEQENGQHSRLYDGVSETLTALRRLQIPMAVITNKPVCFTLPLLERLGLTFDQILGGDSLAQKKPHPAPLLACMENFGVSASQSMMIGDSINDIQAAVAADVKIACVSYGYNHGQDIRTCGAHAVIDSLSELL